MKQLIILCACMFLIIFKPAAQTSVVQDTKGETSLSIGKAGVVAVNAKDESISFSYGLALQKEPEGPNAAARKSHDYMGISVKAKGKNSLAAIFKNDEFQYDGSIGLFYLQDHTPKGNVIWQWYVSSDFLFSQFKLFDSSGAIAFNKQVYDENKSGYKITAGYNRYAKLVGNVPYILGIAFNGGHKNNTADIKAIEVATYTTMIDTVTQQTRLIQKDKSTAYSIKDYKSSLAYFNFNIDVGPHFFNQYFLLLHSRWSVQAERKPQFNPAVGLYFSKADAPLEIVAGIQLQVSDYFNTAESIKTKKQRTVVNVVAGFTF